MSNPLLPLSGLLLLLAPASAEQPLPPELQPVPPAAQQRVTIHVPRVTVTSTTIILRAPRAPALVEKKAANCVEVEKLQGFTVNRFDSVDLVLKDGSLLRARLGKDCPALGFYAGFYVKPQKDKKICAKRDFFRSRSGRSCGIEGFSTLTAAR